MADYDFTYTGAEIQAILDTGKKLKDSGYIFLGVATPSTNPGTPTQKVYYEAKQAGTYTNFGGVVLPDGISLLKWDGSWTSETLMCGDGGVFDISVYKSSGGTLATFADLSAALDGGNNIPASARKGGMSVKFVQSSDNKYVQYRLMSDEFTTDTTQWAIADVGVYVENPEFVYVKTDREGKILWAIKIDGGIYYGAGVPSQVVNYINEKIAELSLDEYEDIVAFLNDLEKGDKTLQDLLNEKVDKEEGKSLIDAEYASAKSTIESPKFLDVTLDAEDKIIEGIQTDGTKVIGGCINVGGSANISGDIKVLGNMEVSGVSYKVIENPEYLAAWVDAEDKVIFGLKADGKTYVGDAAFLNDIKNNQEAISKINATIASISSTIEPLDIDALTSITATENPEFMEVELDAEEKILGGRKTDGTKFENNDVELNGNATVGGSLEVDGVVIKNSEDPEERSEITTDAEGKIVSYRDSEGVLHENVGFETPSITSQEANFEKLNLSSEGLTEFEQVLIDSGFSPNGKCDWSNEKYVQLPIPRGLARVNLIIDALPTTKSDSFKGSLEYWDGDGNYFKKPIKKVGVQGNSSLNYAIKNLKFDTDDKSEWKFGHWVAQDSFHLKAFYIDVFVGEGNMAYNYIESMYQKYGGRPSRNAFIVDTFGITQDTLYTWSNEVGDTLTSQTAIDVDTALQANLDPDDYNLLVSYATASYTNAVSSKSDAVWMQFNKIIGGAVQTASDGSGVLKSDFGKGAMCHPEGFPIELYVNGSYYALYAFNLKKQRDNYAMEKDDYKTIHIDGYTGSLWTGGNTIEWSGDRAIEVRNPKTLICMDGTEYSDDNPKELIDETSENWNDDNKNMKNTRISKNVIKNFSDKVRQVKTLIDNNQLADAKALFGSFIDIEASILHYVISQVILNVDGMGNNNTQWLIYKNLIAAPALYDLDSIFGRGGSGTYYEQPRLLTGSAYSPYKSLSILYDAEIKAFYARCRQDGTISVEYVMSFVNDYINKVGYDSYKRNIDMRKNSGLDIPSYRDSKINTDNWLFIKRDTTGSVPLYDPATVYAKGDRALFGPNQNNQFIFECLKDNTIGVDAFTAYTANPRYLGVYDSPKRIEKFLEAHIAFLDAQFNYNN